MSKLQARLIAALRAENQMLNLPTNVWGKKSLYLAARQNAITKIEESLLETSPSQSVEAVRTLPRYSEASANILNRQLLRFNGDGRRETPWGLNGRIEVKLAQDAVITNWNDYHIVSQGSRIVSDASSSIWPIAVSGIQGFEIPIDNKDVCMVLGTAFLLASDLPPGNFCHFLADTLPRLSFADDLTDKPTIISPVLSGHSYESDALTLIASQKGYKFAAVHPGERIAAANLYYLSHPPDVHPFFACSSWSIDWLRSHYCGLISCQPESAIRDFLVIGRKTRRIINEPHIIELLCKSGSITYIPDMAAYSLGEQISLFRSHRHIVAPHGAALTLLAFKTDYPISCTEVVAAGNGMATFARISHKMNIRHNIYATERVESSHPNYPDMKPNAEELVDLIYGHDAYA